MTLSTDLNVSPYYDDFDPAKDYYRVLFKPGVAVQARELNQLQSILQNQIEKFGDNIFKRGTIIEGCNVQRHPSVPYVKIRDLTTDGLQVDVALYNNLYVRNSSNVEAYIIKTNPGFESQNPDLNTLHVKYISSGDDGNTTSFSAGDTLTVFDRAYPIFNVKVNDGASKFSNSDTVVVMSAIAVQYANGAPGNASNFAADTVIQNGVANAVIIEANTTANNEALILKIRPEYADLITANSVLWRFGAGENIQNDTSGDTVRIAGIVGSGAVGSITTDSLGKVTAVQVVGQGSGYYVPPHVTIANNSTTSTFTATELQELELVGENFLTNITVANSTAVPIGTGYGVTIGEGTIYQKGFFSRVSSQFEVVNKYSNTGFDKSVGFDTTESIVGSNEDPTLLDNATGTYNFTAPGADRLQLTPVIRVLDRDVAEANTDFLPVIEFSDGRPFKTNTDTVYNIIGRQLAQRTFEESGNYVIDEFKTLTKDESVFANTATSFKLNIDPGKAYINGIRVESIDNYKESVDKATTTISKPGAAIRLGLGSYVVVEEVGGVWDFDIGPRVDLYSNAANYVSGGGGTISSSGTKIGEARVRGLDYESGDIGAADCRHRMYLFDINMNSGKSFSSVQSIYYSAGDGAIADIILNSGVAELKDQRDSSLLYRVATDTANVSNITYTFRTVDSTEQANSDGYIVLNLSAGQYFDYATELNSSEKRDLLVVPQGNYTAQSNATGSVAVVNGNTTITGTATQFTSEFSTGDWVLIADGSGGNNFSGRISSIANNTSLNLDQAVSGVGSYSSGKIVLYYPKNIPISLTNKSTKYANVDSSNSQILTIYIGNNVSNGSISNSSATPMSVAVTYNAKRNNVSSSAKTTHRNSYARIRVANNTSAGVDGPWPLGVPDVFRLHGVWKANGASLAVTFDPSTDVNATADFITISGNQFANGDALTYTGTTGKVGLTNSTVYYAVHANSTGTALATTRGGANVNLVTNTSSTETLTGLRLYFTEETTGVVDVTNQFYIDGGQKEDYVDIAKLTRKPGYASLTSNDVLLVKFDAFTTAVGGVKSMGSYSSILDDTANLTSLVSDTKINTMEIPEFEGKNGTYYDLRDYIDIRPIAANTINFVSDISSVAAGSNAASIINPALPSNSAYFAAADGVFPAPNSTLTANIEYYVGRYDRVIIDAKGEFAIRQGAPGTDPKLPVEPDNAITLQAYYVPAYPSLPEGLSSDMIRVADVKINNGAVGRRRSLHTITPLISATERNRIQNRGYTMKDIGALEKRLRDLEYYVSFTLAEALAKARFIPSSLNAAVDRFRFGFFVDPFTNYAYSATDHPEYFATIQDDQLLPKLTEINLGFQPDELDSGLLTLPFNEFTIVNQAVATDGPIEEAAPDPIDTTGEVTVTTVTQTIQSVIQQQRSTARSDNGSVFEEFFYTFSSLIGPVEFYLNARDNNMALTVYQSTTPGGPWTRTQSSASAQRIRQADINNNPQIRSLNDGRSIEGLSSASLNRKSYPTNIDSGTFIEDQFKVVWTHNPADGQYVKIRIYKGKNHGANGKTGTFGYLLKYPTDSVQTSVITVPNPNTFEYAGTINRIEPQNFRIFEGSINIFGEYIGSYVTDSQKFTISVTGLKPNTYHSFFFDSEDKTSNCTQIRTSTTNTTGLLSDANGVMTFEFFYDAGLDEAGTDAELRNRIISNLAGDKRFRIQNTDETSTAVGIIGLSYYTTQPAAAAASPSLNVGGSQSSTDSAVNSTTPGITPTPGINTAGGGGSRVVTIEDVQTAVSATSSYNVQTIDNQNLSGSGGRFDLSEYIRTRIY